MQRLRALGLALGLVVLAACTGEPPAPDPTPSEDARPFTLATTVPVGQVDPAMVTSTADQEFVLNVHQRLMTVPAGQQVLKPDLASDCLFDSELVYMCTLDPEAKFSDGSRLTAGDVKFSIERSQQLRQPSGPRSLWGSLSRVEVRDATTIRFLLNRPDTEFGFALASPAASIVPQWVYPPDAPLRDPAKALGSGPFAVQSSTADRIVYRRNDNYDGPTGALLEEVVVRTFPDSATVEEAMAAGEVDAIWRALSSPAHTRMTHQLEANGERTDAGFGRFTIPGGRVLRLLWSPSSPLYGDPRARALVRDALQDERTLDSIVPPQIPGYRSSFAQGGQPDLTVQWDNNPPLRIAVDERVPDGTDMAGTLRTRLEAADAFGVQIVAPHEDADLWLADETASSATAIAWAQNYLNRSTATSAVALHLQRAAYGKNTDEAVRTELIGTMQAFAAWDATVVPVWQADESLYIGQRYGHDAGSFGPGWQLGYWGFREIG